MKIFRIAFSFVALTSSVMSQTPDSINFFPAHAGDVRQYRSYYTGEIVLTEFFDRDSTDANGNAFIWTHTDGGMGIYEIDSLNDVYELAFLNDTAQHPLLYRLEADSGVGWTYFKSVFGDTIVANVVAIVPGTVFGKQVRIKKIAYTRYSNLGPFWLGNRYLATGFGFVRWDVEPSDVYVLSAAIIKGTKYGTIVSVGRELSAPQTFDMLTNYPNPFNNATVISYTIPSDSHVNITIYDVLGRNIETLVDERRQRGKFEIYFDAQGLASGLLLAVMRTESNILTHKMLYLK